GIAVGEKANRNAFIQNSIYNSGSIGIDLLASGKEPDGINENDVDDTDGGGNQLVNYPTLTVTNYAVTEATIEVDLDIDDTFEEQEGYRIEFFANSAPTDRGGEIYLGYLDVDGDVTKAEVTLSLPPAVTSSHYIAATTSIVEYSAFTNVVPEIAFLTTSELSASVSLPAAEICANGIDDDGDGLVDCADPDCGNYTFAGLISGDELSCQFFDPAPIESEATPFQDERDAIFYKWQKSVDDGANWEDIADANEASFDPFRIGETTLYRRLVKKHLCHDWLISNTIKKRVKVIEVTEIITTSDDNPWCSGVAYTFEAADSGPGSTYLWEFGDEDHDNASLIEATGKGPHTVFFNGGGGNRVLLEVQQEGCSRTAHIGQNIHPILEITNVSITEPTSCGGTDGSISLEVMGAPNSCIEMSLDGGATFLPENQFAATDLPAGAYHVYLRYCREGCPVDLGIYTLAGPSEIVANNDSISGFCPGELFQGTVAGNDTLGENPVFFVAVDANYGRISMRQEDGRYVYTPITSTCEVDQFSYQVCDGNTGCCDFAVVTVTFDDDQAPTFGDLPVDITIGWDDEIPDPAEVTAQDNCPSTFIDFKEVNTQLSEGCGQYDYTITRTWTASDRCGNAISHVQTISVVDETAPDVFRIHTLPNGKKMVAGVMEFTSEYWKTVQLPYNFADNPIIFTQLVTNKEETAATVRLRNVSQNQFQMRLQEAETDDGLRLKESIAWIAMESGEQTDNFHWQADTLPVNHTSTTINFINRFADIPLLFANMQTINDADAATVRNSGVNWNNGKVRIQEENSADPNLVHTAETLGYLAIEDDLDIGNKSGEVVGETGKIAATSEWKTVFFNHTYHNPVVIANSLTLEDFDPATVQVRFVTDQSCQIRIAEWDYLDGEHLEETVGYMVIEGSLPLETGNFCDNNAVQFEFDDQLIALDNTGEYLPIDYDERVSFTGGFQLIHRDWLAQDECGNIGMATQAVYCPGIAVRAKAMLQGALLGSDDPQLMRDDLRRKNLLPTVEPYTDFPNFVQVQSSGGEELKAELLEVEGANAIVDWVFLELRSRFNPRSVVATTVGLVQRDGDIISHRGDSLLTFPIIYQNEYYVSVRHRNHVCMLSQEPQIFTNRLVPMFDFTSPETAGSYAGIPMESMNVMWAGDLNQDNQVIYQGPENDIFYLFLEILLDPNNTKKISNFVSTQYSAGDFNLDGRILFQGPNNDRSALLFSTTLVHPNNEEYFTNFILNVLNKSRP
ncbi:MAG: Ig-like domain-containing protein, partial [Bacteroidota bacterium]